MHLPIEPSKDNVNLKKIIKLLCNTGIRQPLDFEHIKAWLKQFEQGPEYTLALLLLRFLIFRTSDQLTSSLKQALKKAAKHFSTEENLSEIHDWREILNGTANELRFYFGPAKHEFTQPGKSGEIIARLLKSNLQLDSSSLCYPDQITKLEPQERYFLIDDGLYTGEQLSTFISNRCKFMTSSLQTGIIVAIAHEKGIDEFKNKYPNIPIFYGEKITSKNCFEAISNEWVEDEIWPYTQITPKEQYEQIVNKKAKFEKSVPLGFGSLGCLIAYQHGIPDDSLQLLWDKSETWMPLIAR